MLCTHILNKNIFYMYVLTYYHFTPFQKKMFGTKILKIEQTFIAPDRDIPSISYPSVTL